MGNIKIYTLLLMGVILSITSTYVHGQNLRAKQTTTPSEINYWEYLPENYDKGESMPVIFFLHGRGERGDGTDSSMYKILRHGPLKHAEDNRLVREDFSFIILAPQLERPAAYWSPEYVDEFIEHALKQYKIDTTRIYLTGLSLGGNGTWNYAYSNFNENNRLAAIAPIAGWGSTAKVCTVVKRNIPVWAFHGKNDRTVPFLKGKEMMEALNACTSATETDHLFTAYENTGHNSWQQAYDPKSTDHGMNIYEWFLSHQLNYREQIPKLPNLSKLVSKPIQSTHPKEEVEENLATLTKVAQLPESLKETSGLIADVDGNLWTHNDGGNEPYIMQLDTTGTMIGFKKIVLASNYDWEDLAKDDRGNFYIGDVGNNENIRKKLLIYKVSLSDTSQRLKAETISFNYPDQEEFPPIAAKRNFDAEAIIHHNDSLYVFTKNRTEPFDGLVKIYSVPSTPGDYEARLVDNIMLEVGAMYDNWITGADISPDGKTLALLSHSKIWLISCFGAGKLSKGNITKINLDSFTQKEGIAFRGNSRLYITDENFKNIIGGALYTVDIDEWLVEDCE